MAVRAEIGLTHKRETNMQITILFFATYRDQSKTNKCIIEVPEYCTVDQLLKEILIRKYPDLVIHIPSTLVAINGEFAKVDDEIPSGAEVAIFPPVSGGEDSLPTIILLTRDEIQFEDIIEKITLPTSGAAAFFTGTVREITHKPTFRKITYLEYEAYSSMAEAKMKQIAEEIRRKWPKIEGIAIIQRIGKLKPQTPTTLIACTSPHRDDGIFEAAHYGIDRLKEIVPVWKKEVGETGEIWIEGEYIPTPGKD